MKRKITFILIMMLAVSMLSTTCLATNKYIQDVNVTVPPLQVKTFVGVAINYLIYAGYAIAVGMVAYIGIKYIFASADEKASMKGTLVKVFVGACIVALATTLTNFVISVFTS